VVALLLDAVSFSPRFEEPPVVALLLEVEQPVVTLLLEALSFSPRLEEPPVVALLLEAE
jgi:hypothetical protein